MNDPFFSVVIPLYNKEKHIADTLKSVLAQNHTDYEIVVVDDGSTDSSRHIVEQFIDASIRLIRKENGGVSSARNRGIKEAKGKYIAFLDADDLWTDNHLLNANRFFSTHDSIKWYCSGWNVNNDDNTVANINQKCKYTTVDYFQDGYRQIWTSSIVVKKTFIGNMRFSEKYSHGEDMYFWFTLACIDPYIGLSTEVTAFYMICDDSLTQNPNISFSHSWEFVNECIDIIKTNRQELFKTNAMQYLSQSHS